MSVAAFIGASLIVCGAFWASGYCFGWLAGRREAMHYKAQRDMTLVLNGSLMRFNDALLRELKRNEGDCSEDWKNN